MKTTKVDLARSRRSTRSLLGRRAVATLWGGERREGTLERHPREGAQLAVRFEDGSWAATGTVVEVVED